MCAQLRLSLPAVLLSAALSVADDTSAGTVELHTTGLSIELERAVNASLTLQRYLGREVSESEIGFLAARSESEAREALETFGYYDAEVHAEVETHASASRVVLSVVPGEPVKVASKSIVVGGAADQLEQVANAIDAFQPRVGERLDHVRYEDSKGAIVAALSNAGFLGAELRTHEIRVATQTRSAAIDLRWESGERHRFGPVKFSGAQFPPEFLERFVLWQPGDYYSGQRLLDLQQRLVDADYFSLVSVQPRRESATGLEVPIDVELLPAKRSVYTGSFYGSTDSGLGVQGGYTRRWLNLAGHRLQADVDYAQLKESASLAYTVPLRGRSYRNLRFAGSAQSEITDSSESHSTRLAATETSQYYGFTRTLGLQFLSGDFEIGSERGNSVLLYAEGSLTMTRADDPAFPRHGHSLLFGVRLAPESALADTSFAEIGAQAKWVRSVGRNSRLISRATLAAMAVDDFDELPPELRLFAGGDRSIRGFDYQSIGSKNAEGDVIGGTYLAVASIEYEHYFLRNWGMAVFVDAGDAFLKGEFDNNVGVGVGLRWRSPIGAVRIDVGVPVKSDISDEVRLHVVIGPDL